MHDLRKQVLLESGKTVSRKARSKAGTPVGSKSGSPAQSRSNSRVPSRNASDDESELSDGTQWGTNSIDELLAADPDAPADAYTQDLRERIEQILDRKRSSAEGRELSLNSFTVDLMRHYSYDELRHKMGELLPAVLKCVKSGATERETVLAVKAIALMLVTVPNDQIYDAVSGPLKSIISDAEHAAAKLAAIHALSVATFYGGASTDETEEIMDWFLEIISSDGAVIEATDDAEVVTAALEEWGFLATQIEDMEDTTEVAMETFIDQLESSDANVQIAAGENIALLYEKSWTEAEGDNDIPDKPEDKVTNAAGEKMVKRYTVWRQQHLLEQSLEDLSRASSKRQSKKDRKALHQAFNDILVTIEKPTRGPRYSTAINQETDREYGSRLKISVTVDGRRGGAVMIIDKWWKLHRLNALKRLLQGGFMVHYEHNELVYESLPMDVEGGEDDDDDF